MMLRREVVFALGRSILAIITIVGAIICGIMLDRLVLSSFVPLEQVSDDAQPYFKLMAEAWNTIQKSYADRPAVQPRKMAYGSISGMVESLGDTGHSSFLTPEMVKSLRELSSEEFMGVGAEVRMKRGQLVIVAPMDGSPAEKAGLRPGDVILKVDGEDVAGLTIEQAVEKITGKEGTPVSLTILNPQSRKSREVVIIRKAIPIQNITWAMVPGSRVAHVRIAAFSQGVTESLKEALRAVRKLEPVGLILDLRNNSGGIFDQAVGVTSQFLRTGVVVIEQNAAGKRTPVPVEPGGEAYDVPMVVLVNSGTASAAEIVAGALLDGHRAIVVGETTFGTGTVLREFELSDGSALLLAIEEWMTPSGKTIWHKGITPTETVALDPDVTPLFPRAEREMTAAALQKAGDTQLGRALRILEKRVEKPVQKPAKRLPRGMRSRTSMSFVPRIVQEKSLSFRIAYGPFQSSTASLVFLTA